MKIPTSQFVFYVATLFIAAMWTGVYIRGFNWGLIFGGSIITLVYVFAVGMSGAEGFVIQTPTLFPERSKRKETRRELTNILHDKYIEMGSANGVRFHELNTQCRVLEEKMTKL